MLLIMVVLLPQVPAGITIALGLALLACFISTLAVLGLALLALLRIAGPAPACGRRHPLRPRHRRRQGRALRRAPRDDPPAAAESQRRPAPGAGVAGARHLIVERMGPFPHEAQATRGISHPCSERAFSRVHAERPSPWPECKQGRGCWVSTCARALGCMPSNAFSVALGSRAFALGQSGPLPPCPSQFNDRPSGLQRWSASPLGLASAHFLCPHLGQLAKPQVAVWAACAGGGRSSFQRCPLICLSSVRPCPLVVARGLSWGTPWRGCLRLGEATHPGPPLSHGPKTLLTANVTALMGAIPLLGSSTAAVIAFQEHALPQHHVEPARRLLAKEGYAVPLSPCDPEAAKPTGGEGRGSQCAGPWGCRPCSHGRKP